MGAITVRNLDDAVIDQLKAMASKRGTSLEQVARDVLTNATKVSGASWLDEIKKVQVPVDRSVFDAVAAIREDRDTR